MEKQSPAPAVCLLESPAGPLRAVLEEGRLVELGFLARPGRSGAALPPPPTLARALAAWFAGDEGPLRAFPHELRGTPFQLGVWRATQGIRRGEVRTYAEVARAAGFSANHARAAGGALRVNPLGLLVPCHRVVGADGRLTGFGGPGKRGLELKRRLLELEGAKWAG